MTISIVGNYVPLQSSDCRAYVNLTGGVHKWSVPINPAVATDPRCTVSVREWQLPTAARCWLAVVQRAARFCLRNWSLWVTTAGDRSQRNGSPAGRMLFRPAPFLYGHSLVKIFLFFSRPFPPAPRCASLEIHKVCLRLSHLALKKNCWLNTE